LDFQSIPAYSDDVKRFGHGGLLQAAGALFAIASSAIAAAEPLPVSAEHGTSATSDATPRERAARTIDRLIVRFADPSLASASRANLKLGPAYDDAVTKAAGVRARVARAMSDGAWVVELERPVDATNALALSRALEANGLARMAMPDYVLAPERLPDDPLLQQGRQRYLLAPLASYKGIDATGAWDVTTGDASIVVAVVDSGIVLHPDLVGRTIAGYDFVSDVANANDGNGRDADPSDPGDGRPAGACPPPDDSAEPSDWHGTMVAGIIGAAANNGIGVAGVDWNARILPVRVAGRCGARTSDVFDGIVWAAGLAVPGAPPNPTPARVINLSLGVTASCPALAASLFTRIVDGGALVLASAGNANSDARNHFPASCPDVVAVGATDSNGARASYSNYGATVAISAPGGDSSRNGSSDTIASTGNLGTSGPASPAYLIGSGTSFATPLVSGVASLMLAVNPALTGRQLKDLLMRSATAFAGDSGCAPGVCGAGIVNARAAVEAARDTVASAPAVVEFYHAARDHYFISANAQEIRDLDNGVHAGWQRTSRGFSAYIRPAAGLSPVCRFYIPPANGDSHFFSASPAECAQTRQRFPSFDYEAPDVFYVALPDSATGVCPAGTVPVYRVFDNRADANHRYTTSRSVVDQMMAQGWIAEGYGPGPYYPIMCAPAQI
jgi:serine protease